MAAQVARVGQLQRRHTLEEGPPPFHPSSKGLFSIQNWAAGLGLEV